MKLYYFADHTARYQGNSGVQRVVRGLARSLVEANCELVFVAWCSKRKALVPIDKIMLNNLAKFQGPKLSNEQLELYPRNIDSTMPLHESAFATAGLGWLLIPEVTHITFHADPPTREIIDYSAQHRLKTAFIFYDAIPLKHPDYAEAEGRHSDYMQQLALADLIVPISKFAADDLVSFYLNRLYFHAETLPEISPLLLPAEVLERPRQMPLETSGGSKMFLMVGTIEPRKNQVGLLHAFQRFCDEYPDSDVQLVMIGGLTQISADDIRKAVGKNPKVKYLEGADDKTLNHYYSKCDFTVFPSIEEGYGLPIVESLWFGKPCLCANFGSMGEVAEGGGCFTVDTRSTDVLYAALSRMLLEPELRTTLKHEISGRKFTTWHEYGQNFLRLIEKIDEPSTKIRKIFYWVEHTSSYPANSGIQRVTRGLASSLQKIDIPITPVRWNQEQEEFALPDESDLANIEKWNGPKSNIWNMDLPAEDEAGAWLIVTELPTYPDAPSIHAVLACARKKNMRTAIIFFDAIPYKMKEIYPADTRRTHADYMRTLVLFDKVLCISEQSRTDLVDYLCAHLGRLINVEQRIKTVLLPAEFPEIERQSAVKSRTPGTPVKILSVGTLETRKNHIALLEAFKRAKARTNVPMALVLAGQAPLVEVAKPILAYCEQDADITWIGHPDDRVLGDLYRECDFTVYPSLEEGFGLPILESLWYARPCICRNASSMKEVGEGGGCMLVETADPEILASAIVNLAEDAELLHELGEQASRRKFRTWNEYRQDVLQQLASDADWRASLYSSEQMVPTRSAFHAPILSICISTFNRAPWLSISLPLLLKQTAPYRDALEVIVCDNASTDDTAKVVEPHLDEPGFTYIRNRENVGMLGNLKVTAQHAQGQYVWILGDDDLLRHGAVERVMKAILEHPDVSLVYLNYAYTTIAAADQVNDVERFLNDATPIRPAGQDLFAPISVLSTLSENFFTAIYCLVYRRDHALRAYSQNTGGRPFSSLLTCIPTSHYVCHHMMNEAGYWIGEPSLVVNMNVSWGKYAPLWVLERLPELYDLAELKGAVPTEVDRWRIHNLPGALNFLKQIYFSDTENNAQYFSMERFLARHKHLPEFVTRLDDFMAIYGAAYEHGHVAAQLEPRKLLARYGLASR